jgi:hypothetical protein
MKRVLTGLFAATLCMAPILTTTPAHAEGIRQEAANHPRIAKAISQIEDAIAYMDAAPHDFGGHKAAAIQASRAAVEQLKLALAFRAAVDTRHGK